MRLRLLWAVWLLSLLACPTGLLVESLSYPDVPSLSPGEPWPDDPPPQRLAEILWVMHACLSLAAAAAVFASAYWQPWRWIAWVGIGLWLHVNLLFALGVIMAKTGKYL